MKNFDTFDNFNTFICKFICNFSNSQSTNNNLIKSLKTFFLKAKIIIKKLSIASFETTPLFLKFLISNIFTNFYDIVQNTDVIIQTRLGIFSQLLYIGKSLHETLI